MNKQFAGSLSVVSLGCAGTALVARDLWKQHNHACGSLEKGRCKQQSLKVNTGAFMIRSWGVGCIIPPNIILLLLLLLLLHLVVEVLVEP